MCAGKGTVQGRYEIAHTLVVDLDLAGEIQIADEVADDGLGKGIDADAGVLATGLEGEVAYADNVVGNAFGAIVGSGEIGVGGEFGDKGSGVIADACEGDETGADTAPTAARLSAWVAGVADEFIDQVLGDVLAQVDPEAGEDQLAGGFVGYDPAVMAVAGLQGRAVFSDPTGVSLQRGVVHVTNVNQAPVW